MTTTELHETLSSLGFGFIDLCEIESWDESTDFADALHWRVGEQEIIYYSTAIDYLRENDPSLVESLKLAQEYAFKLKDLNSEKLATIHYQEALSQKIGGVVEAIEAYFAEKGAV